MKKKDLIRLIKSKSDEVTIKDFSHAIIEKAKNLPYTHEQIIVPKKSFRFQPLYIFALSSMAIAFTIMMLLMTGENTPSSQFDNIDQVIAFSAVSTASLIEFADEDLVSSSNQVLGFGNDQNPIPPKINQEIVDVSKYLEIMEKLLLSSNDFELVSEQLGNQNYQTRMRFKTRDLVNQEVTYNIYYNKASVQNQNQFSLTGIIEIGENTYDIIAEGTTNNQNHLVTRAIKDSLNYIEIEYNKQAYGYVFNVRTTKEGVMVQDVTLTFNETETQKQIILNFVEGETKGSYMFRLIEINQVKHIRINYYINGTETESGSITVRVMMVMGQYRYSIVITPQGGNSYAFERGRKTTEDRGGFGVSKESFEF